MDGKQLFDLIRFKRSFLCVGLDSDINRLPSTLLKEDDPVFEFNKQIINATIAYAVAYKPNLAFYEARGAKGWESLQKTVNYIRSLKQPVFLIADAKRGDIGNTSAMYAKTFFETMDFDAVTLSPYMGADTVKPFLTYKNKWAVILSLTSNASASDFQTVAQEKGELLYETVLRKAKTWGNEDNVMFVAGATRAEAFKRIRKIVPGHFLLVPGVGAQGGSLKEVARYGMNSRCGLLVNSSRGIIYASAGNDFTEAAKVKARELQREMERLLSEAGLI